MLIQGEDMIRVDETLTMADGTRVMTDGTILFVDGTSLHLAEGEGMIINAPVATGKPTDM